MVPPLRILWVGKAADGGGAGGEEIYDRKLLERLERRHAVTRFSPQPVGRAAKLANLAAGVPLYRATYRSAATIAALQAAVAAARPDVVAISWEPFDFLAAALDVPCVLLLHNVTSDAVEQVFDHRPLARGYAALVRRYERRLYARAPVAALVTLSRRDAGVARALAGRTTVAVVAPGAPPLAPPPAPRLLPELLISGTYDWYPKRRDLLLAARLLAAAPDLPLRVGWDRPLPDAAARVLPGAPVDVGRWDPALRYGLVVDRFASGFKLKVTHYIANNCIVLSRSPVEADYEMLPDHDQFIRRVDDADDIRRIHAELAAQDPIVLAARFEAFKQACAAHLSWDKAEAALSGLLAQAARAHAG